MPRTPAGLSLVQGVESDCFSWLRKASAGDAPSTFREVRHPDFHAELAHFRQLAQLYRAAPGRATGG